MAESRIILALNSGSTSLKFAAYNVTSDAEQAIIEGEIDGIGQGQGQTVLKDRDGKELRKRTRAIPSQESAMSEAATMLREHLPADPAAVGHRIVHGGPDLRDHLIITPKVLAQLEAATHFAPLHIPSALRIVRKAEQLYQSATQIACFDTTFHKTMPELATHLPLPTRYYEAGVRRYGFHGLSCESVLHRVSSPKPGKIIIAHLGGGSSVTAVRDGRSIDTSMGMTPTGGVPMSLRTGDLDPSVLIYLMRTENMSADALETMVNHQCGLVGLSNGEGDMQALLARSDDAARTRRRHLHNGNTETHRRLHRADGRHRSDDLHRWHWPAFGGNSRAHPGWSRVDGAIGSDRQGSIAASRRRNPDCAALPNAVGRVSSS